MREAETILGYKTKSKILLNKTNVSSSRKNTRSPQFIKAVLKDAGLLNKTGKRIYVKK